MVYIKSDARARYEKVTEVVDSCVREVWIRWDCSRSGP